MVISGILLKFECYPAKTGHKKTPGEFILQELFVLQKLIPALLRSIRRYYGRRPGSLPV